MKKLLWVIIILAILVAAFFAFRNGKSEFIETARYDTDTVIEGDYAVLSGEQTTLANNARLTIMGDFTVDGAVACDAGSLTVVVQGMTTLNNTLSCVAEDGEADEARDILLVAKGGLTMSEDAYLTAAGNVQFTNSEDAVLSAEELVRAYDDVENVSPVGQSIGPFTNSEETTNTSGATSLNNILRFARKIVDLHSMTLFAREAHAQGASIPAVIRGRMQVVTPPKGVKQLVVFNFPNTPEVQISDFELSGPDGRAGASDEGANCTAKGEDGEDAFRFNAVAPNLKVHNFTLSLGAGGAGGDAETSADCDPGSATGGNGGKSGNFRMIGTQQFSIDGAFVIHPGNGGNGGGATAKGKDGDPAKKGGDAIAKGGNGAHNKKALSVAGSVAGTNNVQVGDVVGGLGGGVSAEPGNGGDGTKCAEAGGAGGVGSATGGRGGDASLSLAGGVTRLEFATDIGGTGGSVFVFGGKGGNGGACDATGPGGAGGNGGAANATEGKGGTGKSGPASSGPVLDETGGDGGNGGDGCGPGNGGTGGSGDPKGEDGEKGKDLCVAEKKDTGAGVDLRVKVIQFNGKYLPVDQLIVESEIGCGADHWHAAQGVVIATDNTPVPDPGPQCGYGKVRDKPVMEIPVE